MTITYPPEMLPIQDEPGQADVIVCARAGCPKDAEIGRLRAALQEIAENAIDVESAAFAREILRAVA